MDDPEYGVQIGENKFIRKATVLSHLKTYNLYYDGQNLQLRHKEEEGELIVEGLLNIFWGLRRPIRLQMQDDHERIRPPPSSTSWHSGCNLDSQGFPNSTESQQSPPTLEVTPPDCQPEEADEMEEQAEEDSETSAQLLRTKSDAGVLRRGQRRSPSDQRKIRRHRFSINGHFYNHKTSVFTPAFGSVTNVRINSCMRTPQVLRVLLNKFKIENSPDDFALYLVHTSGERVKLKRSDFPLVLRIMQGPCEQVCKVFLMEEDLGEEVTYDVAQYIKFEMPVLQSFITKLKEEEDREVLKLRSTRTCAVSSRSSSVVFRRGRRACEPPIGHSKAAAPPPSRGRGSTCFRDRPELPARSIFFFVRFTSIKSIKHKEKAQKVHSRLNEPRSRRSVFSLHPSVCQLTPQIRLERRRRTT
uniref:Ras-associating domain-containing protein n=1 Tax=Gasterosteus aculeatus aculeatus TaxID=481459 RepID=G3NQ76_GASAC